MNDLPFNACDYRCEHCLATDRCAVFRQLAGLSDELRDADGPGALRSLRESFRETEKAIREKALSLGIDIDEIAGGEAAEIREERESRADPLFERCEAWRRETGLFLKSAGGAISGEDREYLDDIAWHHAVIPAKIFRALGWRTDQEDEIAVDARNSAAVAVKSLTICIMAFDHLAARHALPASDCRRLSADASAIKQQVKARFFPEKE